MFVASSRPPSPTSTTATSTPASAKCASASAVVASKKVAPSSVSRGALCSSHAVMASGAMGTPSTAIRSEKSTRCGEVYRPTRTPAPRSSASSVATVLPLPLVPATWNTG
jgi:hypothetical protein